MLHFLLAAYNPASIYNIVRYRHAPYAGEAKSNGQYPGQNSSSSELHVGKTANPAMRCGDRTQKHTIPSGSVITESFSSAFHDNSLSNDDIPSPSSSLSHDTQTSNE